ncbi:MAG: ArsR family transcriptional regulator [Chloroflexi bacterium]|nr:MAG: ArsR family transcriptional regulator [Chloroflexota bacterium]MBL1196743.1 ArsR family transcriptional regulator [Chloroflexota bacterium]NOH14037.1 winged helix-turn-helix transcriptional regulator [Chloroflexota bacterium]
MTNIQLFGALADPTRQSLFERLRQGPASVNQLTEAVDVSQSAVSQHLRVLREADLVQVQKLGNRRLYSLNPQGLSVLRQYVESLWDDVLGSFQQAAIEQSQQEGR